MTALEYATVSDNGFTGTSTIELVQLNGLIGLDVSTNSLTGTLLTEMTLLRNLTGFSFHGNNFKGFVIEALCSDTKKEWDILEGDCLSDGSGQVEIDCDCCTADGSLCK